MGKLFEKGNKLAKGGARPGAGRKSDEFRRKCKELANSPEFFDWAKRVFKGEKVEPHVSEGFAVMTEASVGSKTHLWDKLADHGHGKPASVLDLEDQEVLFIGVVRMPTKDQGRPGGVKKS